MKEQHESVNSWFLPNHVIKGTSEEESIDWFLISKTSRSMLQNVMKKLLYFWYDSISQTAFVTRSFLQFQKKFMNDSWKLKNFDPISTNLTFYTLLSNQLKRNTLICYRTISIVNSLIQSWIVLMIVIFLFATYLFEKHLS